MLFSLRRIGSPVCLIKMKTGQDEEYSSAWDIPKERPSPVFHFPGHPFGQRPIKSLLLVLLNTEHRHNRVRWTAGVSLGRKTSIALDHSLGFKLGCHNYLKPIKFIYVPKQVH